MGLDITAYEKVSLIRAMSVREYNEDEQAQEEVGRDERKTLLCQDSERPQSDGMPDGIYATSGKSAGFRAGSYGGYNQWRNTLSQMMLGKSAEAVWRMCALPVTATKREAGKPLPFVELINFSDCDGFIGPKTSAKLAKDFAENRSRIPVDTDRWFVDKYEQWARAFALAANGGVVDFH